MHAPIKKPAQRPRNITMQMVHAISPGQKIWDAEVRGFGLRCQRAKKIYFLKANIDGRERWFTIGEHGAPWTPDSARKEAQRLWGEIRRGTDLAAVREARRSRPTMQELCDRYLEEHAQEHKKASSAKLDAANLRNHVLPLLGDRFVEDVTRTDIDHLKRAIKEGKTRKAGESRRTSRRGQAVVTGSPVVANRCLSLLSKMFNLAERWGWRKEHSNPVRHVEKYREEGRERYLSAEELARLGHTLNDCEAAGSEDTYAIALIRLLVLTGARLNEIRTLEWEFVELDQAMLRLPDSKTGKKVIWLNEPAIAVLSALPRVFGNPYVIVGKKNGSYQFEVHKFWKRVCEKAELSNLRIHDLRHSFASIAVGAGINLHVTGKLLGHQSSMTTRRYAHLADRPIREANEAIGRRVFASMNGDVLQLPSNRRSAA